MQVEFEVMITHSQIAVCCEANPILNDWTDEHAAQGFSWREGCVVFGMLDHDGISIVDVSDTRPQLVSAEAERAIVVPFEVVHGWIQISTIFSDFTVKIANGKYALLCEFRPRVPGDNPMSCGYRILFTFKGEDNAEFRILKKGGEMTTDTVLTTKADAA